MASFTYSYSPYLSSRVGRSSSTFLKSTTLIEGLRQSNSSSDRSVNFTVFAAKKGKKKGGGGKKGPKPLLVPKKKVEAPKEASVTDRTDVIMHSLMLLESCKKSTGEPLMEGSDIATAPTLLFEAPFALISTTTPGEETEVDYANKAAMEALGYSWDEITALKPEQVAHDKDTFASALKEAADSDKSTFTGSLLSKAEDSVPTEDSKLWAIKSGKGDVVGVAMSWQVPKPDESEEVEDKEGSEIAGSEPEKAKPESSVSESEAPAKE